MQKPTVATSGTSQMGISWFINKLGEKEIIYHGGATNGQHSGFWFIPKENFALTLLTNSSETPVDNLLKEALKIYLDISIPPMKLLEYPEDKLQSLTGKYENIEEILSLRLKNAEFWLEFEHKGGFPTPDSPPLPVPPPTRIGIYEADKIIALDEPLKGNYGEFLRASDGSLNWFRFGSRIHKKIR